jgi:Holliday junction resolvase
MATEPTLGFVARISRGSRMKTPESFEKDDICKYLDSIGAWYFRAQMGGYGKSGIPDIVGCFGGQFFSIEVKREGKEPTVIQNKRMREIERTGGKAFWGTAEKVIGNIRIEFGFPKER